MHLFIDTNIFEKDPFWKNSFAKIILDKAQNKKLYLYMSIVVYEELKRHTMRNYKKAQKEYTSSVTEINRYLPSNLIVAPKIHIEKIFLDFYNELQDEFNLKILNYKNDFFPKVMDRAINREKPFNDEKTEVKDCTIWLTYADYVETKTLDSCFLITNNTNDFYHKTPKTTDPTEYNIHEDLQIDTKRLRGFPSLKDFFKIILEPQIIATEQFKKWLNESGIDEQYVFDLIYNEESNKIESEINRIVDDWEVDEIFNDDNEWFITGYCQIKDIEWTECSDVELDILENSCIVNATIHLHVIIEGYSYNPVHDDDNDKYNYLGEKDYIARVEVSFILSEGDEYDSFSIDNVDITPD